MHAKAFPLKRNGPKRLLLTWEAGGRNIRLYFDGELVNPRSQNQAFLPDGSRAMFSFNLLGQARLHRNGRPLPGSADDPVSRIPLAAGVCFVVGTLFSLDSLLIMMGIFPSEDTYQSVVQMAGLVTDPISMIYFFAGLVLICCGAMVALRYRVGLWIALAIYGIDTVLMIFSLLQGQDAWLGTAFHVGGMYLMFRAFSGFEMLQAEAAEEEFAAARSQQPVPPRELPSSRAEQTPLFLTPVSSLSMDYPLLQQVEAQLQRGNVLQAKAILTEFMRDNPTNAYGWYLGSFVIADQKRQMECLERSLRFNPALKQAKDRLDALRMSEHIQG